MQAEIGLVGLGVMGANLALNIAEKGFVIAVYNRTWATTEKYLADAGPLAGRIIACRRSLRRRRDNHSAGQSCCRCWPSNHLPSPRLAP